MALIKCPECGRDNVSSKAYACPQCGFPLNVPPSVNTGVVVQRRTQNKYHRLPNGFGQIKYLGKGRRRPYGAYLPVTEYSNNGSAKSTRALGYFETYQQAYDCLNEYNKSPFDPNSTFEEVFLRYYEDKYVNTKKTFSESAKRSANTGFKNCSELHKRRMSDIRTGDMQKILDCCEKGWSTQNNMVVLFRGMFDYAMKNDIVRKDYSQYVKIRVERNDEKGVPFSTKEIEILWKHSHFDTVKIALIMIYSGVRISELQTLKIDKKNRIMVGGIKTKAGIDRVIPIHKSILPFIDMATSVTSTYVYRSDFDSMLLMLGINISDKDTKHTPHDCRHTFSYLADKAKMDKLSKHLIMGHSLGNDIEENTYGHRTTQDLIDAMDLIEVKSPKKAK